MLRKEQPTLQELAEYASGQADMAQIRLIKAALDGRKLYDDKYWQSVLDYIRTELFRLAHNA